MGDIEAVKKWKVSLFGALAKSTYLELFEIREEVLKTDLGHLIMNKLKEEVKTKIDFYNFRVNNIIKRESKSKFEKCLLEGIEESSRNSRNNVGLKAKSMSVQPKMVLRKIVKIPVRSADKIPWNGEEKKLLTVRTNRRRSV